jgi:hypothetical protein
MIILVWFSGGNCRQGRRIEEAPWCLKGVRLIARELANAAALASTPRRNCRRGCRCRCR